MKRTLIAASLLATTAAFAQQPPEVPKAKCEPKPSYPGPRMREDKSVMDRSRRELDAYRKCMTDYLEERKVSIKAHENAANAAVEEFNATMKALADQQNAK